MLAGHDPSAYQPDTWEMLTALMTRSEEKDYLKLTVMVAAIVHAGKMAAGADAGDGLKKALSSYRSIMFPEMESDLLDKAKQNEKLLEQEFKKGPMAVKALDYGTKRKNRK